MDPVNVKALPALVDFATAERQSESGNLRPAGKWLSAIDRLFHGWWGDEDG